MKETQAVENRWLQLWNRAGAKGDPYSPCADLVRRYSEPHRFYHTLSHITHCLEELECARHLAVDPDAIEMAIWFHDAIYDTRASDNEERSAELAVRVLRDASLPGAFGRNVSDLILTSKHRDLPPLIDGQIFADVDLSILGQATAAFDEYEEQVRREYARVPDVLFAAGRSAILGSILHRPNIYSTTPFRSKYEEQARKNLARSLGRWKGAQP